MIITCVQLRARFNNDSPSILTINHTPKLFKCDRTNASTNDDKSKEENC